MWGITPIYSPGNNNRGQSPIINNYQRFLNLVRDLWWGCRMGHSINFPSTLDGSWVEAMNFLDWIQNQSNFIALFSAMVWREIVHQWRGISLSKISVEWVSIPLKGYLGCLANCWCVPVGRHRLHRGRLRHHELAYKLVYFHPCWHLVVDTSCRYIL